jgi:hypothetical protein
MRIRRTLTIGLAVLGLAGGAACSGGGSGSPTLADATVSGPPARDTTGFIPATPGALRP